MGDLGTLQQMVSSCTGAIITSLFMTPFDVVKVRLQAQQRAELSRTCFLYCNGLMDHLCKCAPTICTSHPDQNPWYNRPVPVQLNGTVDAFVKISRQEGIQSLWSGLSPTLIVAVPNTVIYFTTYEHLRTFLHRHLPTTLGGDTTPSSLSSGLAGGLARVWAVTVVSPFELVRTKMQASNISYGEVSKVLQSQVTNNGLVSLWRGWVPTVLRDVPFSVLYWLTYEQQKIFMNQQQQPSFQFTLYAGAVSGGIAGTLTLPLDVIKTHRQIALDSGSGSKSGSTYELLEHIYRRQGVRGLFSGVVPRLAKVMPACAIMISSYEYAKKFFRQRRQQEQ